MNKVKTLSCYLECSSGCSPRVNQIKKFIDYISAFGYQELYFGLTDAYKIKEYPYFNYHRGSYSKDELLDIESYAYKKGIKVIPAIQVLGHLEYLWRHESFRGFMDTKSILEVGNPKSYQLVDAMFKSMSESFKGRTIHIGMDETFGLGMGEYLNKYGLKDKKVLLLEYLKEVVKIAKKYNFNIEIWGDMLTDNKCTTISTEDIKRELPEHTLVWLWDYDSKEKKVIANKIKEMSTHASEIGFAGCAWKHISYVANNNYSIPRLVKQLEVCSKYNIDKYMVTMWADFAIPSSIYSVLPSLFVASECNLNNPTSPKKLNKKKFKDITGIDYDDLISLDLLNNPYRHDRTKYYNNTSYIAFFSDLLVGNYDCYASEEVNNKYKLLARKYARIARNIKDNNYKYYFDMISKYARVLSIKIHLSESIREAYYQNNKILLKQLLKQLSKLKIEMKIFIKYFERYYLNEFQGFGIEISQLHHNYILARIDYLKRRLLDFIDNGVEIDEFKEKTLRANYIPEPSEDCYLNNTFEWLITYNSITK